MDLLSYLIRFFLYYIHKRYFITLYRSSILLSHRFGLMVMVRSLFKPLFGMLGFISRINGFVIRSISIVFAVIIITAYLALGLAAYTGFWILLSNLFFDKFFYFLLIILGILICGIYNYYFFTPVTVKDKKLRTTWPVKSMYSAAKRGNPKLLYSSFEEFPEIKELLQRLELPFDDTMKFIELNIREFNKDKFKTKLTEFAEKNVFCDDRLSLTDLFAAYFLQFPNAVSHMNKHRFDETSLVESLKFIHNLKSRDPKIWDPDFKLPPAGGTDKGWAVSYTPTINKVGTDLTKMALKGDLPRLVGREDVKDAIISVLSKPSSNNVLLLGAAGTGKTTFVKALAREIALGTAIPALKYKRMISLDMGNLSSGKNTDITKTTSQIAQEAQISGNIILFMDEIHNAATLSSNDPNASIVFATLEPYLASARFQFIGTTSRDNYLKYIKPNEAFARTFDVIELRETDYDETILLMQELAKTIEPKYKIKYTYPALKTIYEGGKRYVTDRALPDKAMSILTQSYTSDKDSDHIVTKNEVLTFIANRFRVPVQAVDDNERERLLNLENLMKSKIIGQDQAITLIAKALKRARAGIRNENKPIASFLFSGPTGVGKTETAKVLAETYFGNKDRMIRIDMSEYQDAGSVNRLIGDSNGQIGYLIAKIQETPYTLILLDEIEKADKNVLNLFLQVLDDGRLTSSSGKTYDFTNSFIIMTTNVGTKAIRKSLMAGVSLENIAEVASNELKEHFPIEFLNRFTALIPYSPLTKENVSEITQIKLKVLHDQIMEKKIDVQFTDNLINQVAEMAYSPEWGARELNRIIEDKVETTLAEKMIAGEINSGDTYKFDMIQ